MGSHRRSRAALLVFSSALGSAWLSSPWPCHAATDGDGSSCIQAGGCTLADLKTATSPAFLLIGSSPTLVERPTTPQDVAVTVYNAAKDSGGLPHDFALEIAPYWLFQHAQLTYASYTKASVLRQMLYNATVSAATTSGTDMTSATAFTDLGVGMRTQFFVSLATNAQAHDVQAAEEALAKVQQQAAVSARLADVDANIARLGCDQDAATSGCADLLAQRATLKHLAADSAQQKTALDEQLARGAQALHDADVSRNGLTVSLAGALSGRTPQGEKLAWHEPAKEAAWINAGYQAPSFAILGVGRYIHVARDGSLGFADAGVRLDRVGRRFGVSAEYVHRWVVNQPAGGTIAATSRLTGTVEVAMSDSVFLSATLGQDVATESHPAGAITLLGLSFQASRQRKLQMPLR